MRCASAREQIVAELERRVRARAAQAKHAIERVKHATDVRAQIKEHPGVTIAVSSAAAVALGVGVYVAVARMLERRKPMNRLKGRLYAYKALLAEPHRALRPREPLGKRLSGRGAPRRRDDHRQGPEHASSSSARSSRAMLNRPQRRLELAAGPRPLNGAARRAGLLPSAHGSRAPR